MGAGFLPEAAAGHDTDARLLQQTEAVEGIRLLASRLKHKQQNISDFLTQ